MKNNDSKIFALEMKIAKFLRYGILVAGAFIAIGWLSSFSWTMNPFDKFQTYQHVSFMQQAEIAFMEQDPWFFVSFFGLFVLISLPVIRVMLTGFLFFKQKEKAMGTMAFVVLFFLVLSFVFGFEA